MTPKMNLGKRQHILILLLLICEIAWAQDPHFSQYFRSPLTLNPANTGGFEGSQRLATNFRNQWQGIGDPYVTGTVSFDTEIMKDKLGNGNRLAVGVLGLFDRTAGGGFNSSYLSASVGYHLYLNPDETDKLSIGFQATLVNKRLDNTILSYANQFTNGGFDLSLPSNETFARGVINYVDFNTGALYTHQSENGGFYIGTALYHILRPTESFLGSNGTKVLSRINLNAGGYHKYCRSR